MKKLLALLIIAGVIASMTPVVLKAQDKETYDTVTMQDMKTGEITIYVVNSSGADAVCSRYVRAASTARSRGYRSIPAYMPSSGCRR